MVIIAAVDDSKKAANVIREAESLAQAYEDKVHIVHALSQSEFVKMGVSSVEEGDPIDIGEVREGAAKVADNLVENLSVPFETVGLVGDPAPSLVNYASEQNARYMVIAVRKRSPAGKAIFGSVSQSVLLNASCPVVSVIENLED